MSSCPLCNQYPSRKEGVECRRCYKKLWMRKYRQKPEVTLVSLEANMFLVDKLSFDQWNHAQ